MGLEFFSGLKIYSVLFKEYRGRKYFGSKMRRVKEGNK